MKEELTHSEEFRSIIGRFPTRFNSILAIALFAILGLFFFFSWIIKSPEVITADVRVTAEKPPISLLAQVPGKIEIVDFAPKKIAEAGAYLAVIENTGNHRHIRSLKDSLLLFQNHIDLISYEDFTFALNYSLGDIQVSYFDFLNTLFEIDKHRTSNEYDLRIALLKEQEKYNARLYDERNHLRSIKIKEIDILNQRSSEDSLLAFKNNITRTEAKNDLMNLLRENESLKGVDLENIRTQLAMAEIAANKRLQHVQKDLRQSTLRMKLLHSYQQLLLNIGTWENRYVIKSPTRGQLDILSFVSTNEFVAQGEPLFSVLPEENKIIAQLLVPSAGAGKVRVGQEVNIKLNAFPYQEFGRLQGVIKSISLIPSKSNYLVVVELPKGLVSESGMALSFGKSMEGQAEVIIGKKRLLKKFFEKISNLFNKQKTKPPQETDEHTKNTK